MARRNVVKAFKNMSPSEIRNLSRRQAQSLLKEMRQEAQNQIEKLDRAAKHSDKFYSPAGESMKSYYEQKKVDNQWKAPSKTPQSSAIDELIKINNFMNSKTYSVTETQKLQKSTDMRIFGPSESNPNKPAQRMSRQESEKFWAAYNEFKNSVDTGNLYYRKYSQIQSELGKMVIEKRKKKREFSIVELANELKYRLNEDDYEYSELSEFSADWDDYDE